MSNIWQTFRALTAGPPRLLGSVATVHGDGTVTVELVAGGTLRAIGEAEAGARVFVRAGKLEGAAPTGIAVLIEIEMPDTPPPAPEPSMRLASGGYLLLASGGRLRLTSL
ncbi:hypothetical protein [Chitinimonas koreensis]|uniref:hypothetical protein n=1 Tax=Chitinimonas koreensis TaxID=356302 RepID=UPI0004194920|nr:hypothetical protein [Chitinimonas koreensis]QNM94891.1 hypothetical protein H9L41_13265 [Chitinimonas koreensis]